MTHATEEDLVLYFYGEAAAPSDVGRHLQTCAACAREYEALARSLQQVVATEAPDPGEDFWRQLREGVPKEWPPARWLLAACVWAVALLYPFAPGALFESARMGERLGLAGAPVVALALAWAFAGPCVALLVLGRMRGTPTDHMWSRLIVYGAVAATISPALFNLTSRTGRGLGVWYASLALIAAASLLPVSAAAHPTARVRRLHRASALLILIFALIHVANHVIAIVNVPTHSALLAVLRAAYRQPAVEVVLLAAIAFQIASGGALVWWAHLRRPTVSTGVQMLSGVYLAVFFMAHVTAALMARPDTDTNFVWAAGQRGLLASPRLTYLLPYYLLGVAALFAHVGQYARVRLLRVMPVVSVQRLSYAGMAVGATVVLTIGLALCGVHVLP
jgi:hypothetical protein